MGTMWWDRLHGPNCLRGWLNLRRLKPVLLSMFVEATMLLSASKVNGYGLPYASTLR